MPAAPPLSFFGRAGLQMFVTTARMVVLFFEVVSALSFGPKCISRYRKASICLRIVYMFPWLRAAIAGSWPSFPYQGTAATFLPPTVHHTSIFQF